MRQSAMIRDIHHSSLRCTDAMSDSYVLSTLPVNWFVEVLIRSSSERLIFQLYICREIVSDCPLSNAQCLCVLRQALNVDERTGDEESCNQELECQLHDEGVDARRISRSISELLVDGAIISCPRILVKTDSCIIHFC